MEEPPGKFHDFSKKLPACVSPSAQGVYLAESPPVQLRDTGSTMKSLSRISVPLLAAALGLPQAPMQLYAQGAPPQAFAQNQDRGQQDGGGMGSIQDHSVRGDITAISGDSITVKTEEGEVYTVATGPNTRLRKQRDQIKITDLHIGDVIAAIGDKDPKARTVGAVFVMVLDKEQYAKARADFGKTWTTGVVQSIDGTNIVVKRPDNVTQTISVDENTSFRKHREDITLPDIKVGDNVNARGALQKGTFVATELNVGGPGGPGGFGGGAARRSASNAPTSQPEPQSNN